ncbi:MAG: hypothetical protein JO036_02165 [Candidatus Eremiobacteraeota bacterium]|nr:hypothetical protein [Candidatus Eremiobacteraeota bacterium]
MIGIGVYGLVTKSDVDRWIPYAALFISVLVIIGIRLTMVMPMLQMKQIDDQRQDTAKLVEAIQDLTKELRRRPEVSSTVKFSLFGSKE